MIHIVWQDNGVDATSTPQIRHRRFDGTKWTDFGQAISDVSSPATRATLCLDPAGQPYVGWTYEDRGEVHAAHWDGKAWVQLSASASNLPVSDRSSEAVNLVLSSNAVGRLVAAWQADDPTTGRALHVASWNGSTWVGMGGAGSLSRIPTSVDAEWPHLTTGPSHAYLMWEEPRANGTRAVIVAQRRLP